MPAPTPAPRRSTDALLRVLAIALISLTVFHILFRYCPDLQWIVVRDQPHTALTDFDTYEAAYLDDPAEVFTSRFAGNRIVYHLARGIERVTGVPVDIRAHPLRMSATIVTALFVLLGVAPFLLASRAGPIGRTWDWRVLVTAWTALIVLGLRSYHPFDVPSLACLSLLFLAMLRQRYVEALAWLVIGSLFRETMIHGIAFMTSLTIVMPSRRRFVWLNVFTAAWLVEYFVIRHLVFDMHIEPKDPFVWRQELFSLSFWGSVGLLGVIAALAAVDLSRRAALDGPRGRPVRLAFWLNVAAVPCWLVFYRFQGNISEFRMLMPIALPFVFSLAIRPGGMAALEQSAGGVADMADETTGRAGQIVSESAT